MEIIKVFISFSQPIIILVLGIWAKQIATSHEKRLSLNDRIIEKRVTIYEKIGSDLNDIYAFLVQVGDWKKFTPEQIIEKKRRIDKTMYINQPYWSDIAFNTYNKFMKAGFETFTSVGEDAKIKTYTRQFEQLSNWNSWERHFSIQSYDHLIVINKEYKHLMAAFSEQFGYF